MTLGRGVRSSVAALMVFAGACSSTGPENGPGTAGQGAAGGTGGIPAAGGGPAQAGGGNGAVGGSGGGVTAAGGTTPAGGGAGAGGAAGSAATGVAGTTGSGAGGMPGAAGEAGRAGAGHAGSGGSVGVSGNGGGPGSGGVPGSGGGAGGAGLGGRGGASGGTSAGSGTGGSAGSSTGMRSPGCGKTPTLTSGSRTIQTGGQSRSYILRIPDNYDNSHPYRLIFAYHWVGGTMQDVDGGGSSGAAWSYYGLRAQANNSTIFVAPQGISNGWGNSGGADVKFTDDMISLIEGDLCVDTTQLFAMGFSYGGSMSYAIACARATVFRAVAVYSGGVLSGCDGGTAPIAYIGIHGVSDGTLNISGGRSMRDKFVMNDGCMAMNPPEPSAGSGMHICTSYQGCKAGYPVEWCAFDGGHTPGNVDGGGDDGAKTWTKGEVWKFFTQFQ